VHRDFILAIGGKDLLGLALALGLGLLVGVQRGWAQRNEPAGARFAGIRTYGLFGLAGGLAAVVTPASQALAAVILVASGALVVAGYWRASQGGPTMLSGTASLVCLLTLACGWLAASGAQLAATAATGSIVLVLALRAPLHRLIRSLDEREVMAIGRFALIALVILPLLPNTPMGPYGAWKPQALWLVVVMVSGFSFAGYLAAKWLGPRRGTLATAATAAMVSSTAVTAAMAARHRAGDGSANLLNAAITLASAVMFVRVMVLAAVLAPLALPTLATGAVPGVAASLIGTALLRRRDVRQDAEQSAEMTVRNPFDIGPALLMLAMVMALTAAARWVLALFGDRGLAVVLAITGVVDVDSAIITMGSLPPGTLAPRVAGLVLLPPIILNTLLKAGIAVTIGGKRGWPAAATLVASAVAALLPLVVSL
jgi:uncharacterized membrane protein (DUF4010 family)